MASLKDEGEWSRSFKLVENMHSILAEKIGDLSRAAMIEECLNLKSEWAGAEIPGL